MANLIITVISIALVAVAALMGAYYGGTAFMEGQAKAKANAMMNQGQQIGIALQAWWVDSGRGRAGAPDWDTSTFTSTSLIPKYLQEFPRPIDENLDAWVIIYRTNTTITTAGVMTEGQNISEIIGVATSELSTSPSNQKICEQLNKAVTNSASFDTVGFVTTYGTGSNAATLFNNQRARCIYDSDGGTFMYMVRI